MINLNKLNKVVQKDGKIEAQCPACHQAGADSKGNHLVIYPNGSFGCVANPGEKSHNKMILQLAGEKGVRPPPQLQIQRQVIQDSQVVLRLGRPGQKNPTPAGRGKNCGADAPRPTEPPKSGPSCPEHEDFVAEEAR